MPALKCPNSTCSFLFDPAKVPAGAMLACPRCQTKFRIADAPIAEPAAEREPRFQTPSQPEWKKWLPLVGICLLLAIGIGAFAAAVMKYQASKTDVGGAEEQLFTDHNCGIRAPLEPWERDRDLENQIGVNLGVYTRVNPAAWVAYAAQKYDTRNARQTELTNFVDERLRKLCDNIQKDDPSSEKWLGQDATKVTFRGTHKLQVVNGECLAVSIGGVAYYFFAWAAERESAGMEAEWTAAKKRIRMLGRRDTWKESATNQLVFASKKLDYKVIDAESIWREPANRPPADQDPLCDLYLEAEYQPKGKRLDTKPRAELLAYVLPKGADPERTAMDFITKRSSRNPELFQEFVFEDVKEPISGDEPLGSPPGEPIKTKRLKMTHPNSPDVAKFIVMSAFDSNGKTVVVEAICPWNQRSIWERRMVNIAGSLQSTVK